MSYGYDPRMSEGALVPPIFLSSTFVFESAEDGKRFFEVAYGLAPKRPGEELGLIYSRLNNPNLQILEERLTLFEKGSEAGAVFASGMAAITTTLLALLTPGDVIVSTEPVYGGTDYLFRRILPKFGISVHFVPAGIAPAALRESIARLRADGKRPAALYIESPANPTNVLTDIAASAAVAHESAEGRPALLVLVDNTFMGPLWQHPMVHGADLVLYSATKFIGGHSDLVAGAVLGRQELLDQILVYRTILGTITNPFDGYLMLRSLDTLKMRMTAQAKNARDLATWLTNQPKVERVHFPGLLPISDGQYAILQKQCRRPGSMISFEIRGGEAEAFRLLNSLRLIKLAVSLGGTKTLIEHPASMTHSDVPPEERRRMGISEGMIRLSVGVEHPSDLIADLAQALEKV